MITETHLMMMQRLFSLNKGGVEVDQGLESPLLHEAPMAITEPWNQTAMPHRPRNCRGRIGGCQFITELQRPARLLRTEAASDAILKGGNESSDLFSTDFLTYHRPSSLRHGPQHGTLVPPSAERVPT